MLRHHLLFILSFIFSLSQLWWDIYNFKCMFIELIGCFNNRVVYSLLSNQIFKFESEMGRQEDQDYQQYNETHGKIVDGKYYTYKQLQNQCQIAKFIFCIFMFLLIAYCLFSFYVVDYKEGTQQDVIRKIANLPNYTIDDIVNGSIQITQQLTDSIVRTFTNITAWEKGEADWHQQAVNQTQTIHTQSGNILDFQNIVEHLLHFPVYLKNWSIQIYQKYIQKILASFAKQAPQGVQKIQKVVTVQTIQTGETTSTIQTIQTTTIQTTQRITIQSSQL